MSDDESEQFEMDEDYESEEEVARGRPPNFAQEDELSDPDDFSVMEFRMVEVPAPMDSEDPTEWRAAFRYRGQAARGAWHHLHMYPRSSSHLMMRSIAHLVEDGLLQADYFDRFVESWAMNQLTPAYTFVGGPGAMWFHYEDLKGHILQPSALSKLL
jgi:hypothetical protein